MSISVDPEVLPSSGSRVKAEGIVVDCEPDRKVPGSFHTTVLFLDEPDDIEAVEHNPLQEPIFAF